jgi:hypothetical protein
MLKQFVANTGATVYSYNVGGCPFISLQPWMPGRDDRCKTFGDASVADMLPNIKPGDIVFLASLRLPRMVEQWTVFGADSAHDAMYSELAVQGRQQATERALPVLREITARGAHVVFEAPTPMLESIPYRCADWFNRDNPICVNGLSVQRSLLENLRAPILASYGQIEKSMPNVSVWDPLPTLCPGDVCHAYRDGKPLLFDGDHITYFSNMLLLPSFTDFITNASSQPEPQTVPIAGHGDSTMYGFPTADDFRGSGRHQQSGCLLKGSLLATYGTSVSVTNYDIPDCVAIDANT